MSRAGGIALVAKYGTDHMRKIGSSGGRKFWQKYTIKPIGTSGWAIVDRETKQVVGYNNWKGLGNVVSTQQ